MPAPSRARDWLDQLQDAADAGAIVTLLVRFRRLVGKDQQPYRSTMRKRREVKATTLGGSLQLFGNGASAERVLEQLGGDPYGKLEEWASEISQGEAAGVTSVDVFVVGEMGGPWPKG